MPRLSIEISDEVHRRLKASAALSGQSIKDYVLARALTDAPDNDALEELASVLKPRINAARRGEISSRTIDEIAKAQRKKRRR